MRNRSKERRLTKRVFFTLEDEVTATIENPDDPNSTLSVALISLSEGGLSFVGIRHHIPKIKKGNKLIITSITTPEEKWGIDKIEVKVKYIIDLETYIRIAIGCEFTQILDADKTRIQDFVQDKLEKSGLKD
jgi:hypothetical protein